MVRTKVNCSQGSPCEKNGKDLWVSIEQFGFATMFSNPCRSSCNFSIYLLSINMLYVYSARHRAYDRLNLWETLKEPITRDISGDELMSVTSSHSCTNIVVTIKSAPYFLSYKTSRSLAITPLYKEIQTKMSQYHRAKSEAKFRSFGIRATLSSLTWCDNGDSGSSNSVSIIDSHSTT
jgi:hypothetical protein